MDEEALRTGHFRRILHQRDEADDEAPTTRRRRRFGEQGLCSSDGAVDPLLGRLVLACWRNFFALFRPDELAMEFPRYQQEAEEISAALNGLGKHETPDLVTCKQILFLLSRFNRQRFHDFNGRIDELAATCRDLQASLEAARLTHSVNDDELQRTRQLLDQTLQRLPDQRPGTDELQPAMLAQAVIDSLERDRHTLHAVAEHLDNRALAILPPAIRDQLLQIRSDAEPDPGDALRRGTDYR